MNASVEPQIANYDVAIVGAGPAGLAAAALLGRCRRRVVVIGLPERENSTAAEVHNLPYAEGVTPDTLYANMESELKSYDIVQLTELVTKAQVDEAGRRIVLETGADPITASRLLLANGVDHEIPEWVPDGAWGTSVFLCPFCHAYEHSGEDFLIVGPPNPATLVMALMCTPHPKSLTVLMPSAEAVDGPYAARVRELDGEVLVDTVAAASTLTSGELLVRTAGEREFVVGAAIPFGITKMTSELVSQLGLRTDTHGAPEIDDEGHASERLVWVAGTAAKPHYVLAEAMASGLRAAMAIHRDLVLDFPR